MNTSLGLPTIIDDKTYTQKQNIYFVGIDSYGSSYGPIKDQYIGDLIFEQILISPRTNVIISNAQNHNGIKIMIQNTTTNLKQIDLIELMKRGEIDRCVSYKILENTDLYDDQGLNKLLYVMIIIITILIVIIVISYIYDNK